MLFRTHLAFGILIVLLFWGYLGPVQSIILLFFSILPDIDKYSSKISKKLGIFSSVARSLSSHRGFFHSILPVLIMIVFGEKIFIAGIYGYLSHLMLDSITLMGIRPFFPLKFKIKGPIKVGSYKETILFLIMLGLIGFLLLTSVL